MKKPLKTIICLGLCAGIALSAGVVSKSTDSTYAETVRVLSYSDTFDSSSLDEGVWYKGDGVTHEKKYSALRLGAINTWGSYVVQQAKPLDAEWGKFAMEFTADWLDTKSGWTGIFIGNPSPSSLFSSARYMLHIAAGNGIRLSGRSTSGSGFATDGDNAQFVSSDMWKQADLSSGGKPIRIRLEFSPATVGEEKGHKLTLKWGFDGEELKNSYYFGDVLLNVNGYAGFTTYGTTVFEMRDFKLETGGEALLSDDFTEPSISYPSLASGTVTWRCVGTNCTEETVYLGDVCDVKYTAPRGNLVYLNELSVNPYSTRNFELGYKVSRDTLSESAYVGSGFGLGSITDAADKNGFIGIRKKGDGYALALIKNGAVVGSETDFEASGFDISLTFTGYYDGSVAVKANGTELAKYKNVDFAGYPTVSSLALSDGATVAAEIDDFSVYEYETLFADNYDYRINFKGRKEEETASGTRKDFWYNTKNWVKYGEVTEPNLTINQNRNYIMFQNTRMEAGFAPKKQYGDFIARFDFKVSSLDDTSIRLAPFGFSFGRDNVASSAKTSAGVYFEPVTVASTVNGKTTYSITGTRVTGLNVPSGDSRAIDVNIYENTTDWYTCMVVFSNRTVKVYLKKTTDGEDFGKPVATYRDVDAHGYTAVTYNPSGSDYAYYWVTNISVIGTDLLKGGRV